MVGPLEAGQIACFGRESKDGPLEEIPSIDWVGSEVSPSRTSDLVVEGWRKTDLIGQALGEVERKVRHFDLHLKGASVRQLSHALGTEKLSDTVHAGAFDRLEAIDASSPQLALGYWSPLVSGAWVSSRCENLTAAIQAFEEEQFVSRGGVYSIAAYWAVSDFLAKRNLINLTFAIGDLITSLEQGVINDATARAGRLNAVRVVQRHEWRDYHGVHHESEGVSLLPNLYDFGFPSEEVMCAFPAPDHRDDDDEQAECENIAPPSNDVVLDKCDQLWLEGHTIRKIEQMIPKIRAFKGIKAGNIRDLTRQRYDRPGRGKRTPDMINK